MQECTTLKQALFLLKIQTTQGASRKRGTGLETWRAGSSCLEVAGSQCLSPQFSHPPFLFIRHDAVAPTGIEPSPLRQPLLFSIIHFKGCLALSTCKMAPNMSSPFVNSGPPTMEAWEFCRRVVELVVLPSPSYRGPSSHLLYPIKSLFAVLSEHLVQFDSRY